jgi:type IV secretory pathway VirB3-like protein
VDRQEILFLALTRPALIQGVPVEAFAINAGVTFLSGMVLSAPTIWRSPIMFWLACVPIHFILQRITSWDYHGFRTIRLWLMTTGMGRTDLTSQPGRALSAKEVATSG